MQFKDYVSQLAAALDSLDQEKLLKLAKKIIALKDRQGALIIAGNGGSAATAAHAVCDLGKTAISGVNGKRLKVLSLGDNVPALTAWGNDLGYEFVFSEALKSLGRPGDLFLAISASGNSKNIIEALKTAKASGLETFAFLGFDGGRAKDLADGYFHVQSNHYGIVEDVHMIAIHFITDFLRGKENKAV